MAREKDGVPEPGDRGRTNNARWYWRGKGERTTRTILWSEKTLAHWEGIVGEKNEGKEGGLNVDNQGKKVIGVSSAEPQETHGTVKKGVRHSDCKPLQKETR